MNSYQDPFEEYKNRQEKKRARKAAGDAKTANEPVNKKEDDTNWFGVKIGLEKSGTTGMGGVGKYLNVNNASNSSKRPLESTGDLGLADDAKKKRKMGFGNFDNW